MPRKDDKDKLVSNPDVPSFSFGGPIEGGRNFRAKADKDGMANRVGKQWAGLGSMQDETKELVPLPESPRSKAKPKVANLPGVYSANAPTLFGNSPKKEQAPKSPTNSKKPGKLNLNKNNAGGQAPTLFSGSDNYFSKATGGSK